ncbi:hypothetical protein IEQ34_011019 [Dendrobium chrysotoxum]|uniref:TOD1/MUCI70 glycosyltransferase-like domain-containing protein n=1 Tax=Dendrobium chrysotoxum TaxID=161865 RepID=A0AAV7GWE3_DENCH|nr:hypothetical protein IEQ34_011019 [Dendrobium chrysotoxum]
MAQHRQSGTDRFSARSQIDVAIAGDQIGLRIPQKIGRIRRAKPQRHFSYAAVVIGVTLLVGFYLSILAFHRLSELPSRLKEYGENNKSEPRPRLERTLAFKELRFGHSTDGSGRDSRYWDRDDRRRDDDYSEEEATGRKSGNDSGKIKLPEEGTAERAQGKSGSGRLYNEGGRKELDSYRKKYEDSLNTGVQTRDDGRMEQANPFDEYDDGFDEQDEHEDLRDEGEHWAHSGDSVVVSAGAVRKGALSNSNVKAFGEVSSNVGWQSQMEGGDGVGGAGRESSSGSGKKVELKRKPKHHKSSRSSCEMKFLDSTARLVEPLENKKFSRFSLQYVEIEERPSGTEDWEPRFAGHQSPREREHSYYAHDQKINCGFIKGPPSLRNTGFDLAEDDIKYMSSCHIAVSSCIFGNSDHLRTPYLKTISRQSRKNVCFIMFVDEITLQTLLSEGQKMDSTGFIGLWKIVVVHNLPYPDMRRVGKIPKFLTHRLFPSARYSIWLDSKLRLQNDPYLILEYFLWRRGYEYAISNHYDRHCVWEEVAQNKKLNKYNHTVIDQQFEFYQSDGLKRFDPSDPNKLLPSYVPEGSFIVRAHTPMSNLFSCLWFNEVDHWTPRDQLSFAYTYLKLKRKNPDKNFHLNMFKDCERRSIAKLFRHRAEDRRNISIQ